MASDPTGFLTLRTGTFQRTTRATAEGTFRVVGISNCPVTHWTVIGYKSETELDGRSFEKGHKFQLWISEAKPGDLLWKENPEKIGAFNSEEKDANLFLSPDAFASFWAAAIDGATHTVELVLKSDGSDILCVTNVGLFEVMPPPPAPSNDGLGIPMGRVHPVVAELRTMREQLSRSILFWVCILAAVWLGIAIMNWLRS